MGEWNGCQFGGWSTVDEAEAEITRRTIATLTKTMMIVEASADSLDADDEQRVIRRSGHRRTG
jgi:hypothetical protein